MDRADGFLDAVAGGLVGGGSEDRGCFAVWMVARGGISWRCRCMIGSNRARWTGGGKGRRSAPGWLGIADAYSVVHLVAGTDGIKD